jgi:hypothetical protein
MLDAWLLLETLELAWDSRITLAQLLATAGTNSTLRQLLCTAVVRAGEPSRVQMRSGPCTAACSA